MLFKASTRNLATLVCLPCTPRWLNEKDAALEVLTSFKRAGADLILTYYGLQAAKWLAGEK